MKKYLLILVMLLMAATSFNQPSRRSANNTKPAGQERRTNTSVKKSTNQDVKKSSAGSQNRSSNNQNRTSGTRPETRKTPQTGNKPANTPKREYKSTSPQQPVRDQARRTNYDSNRDRPGNDNDVRKGPGNNDDRGSRQSPRVVNGQKPHGSVNKTAKGHVDHRSTDQRVENKGRPVYHSSRKFVKARPVKHHYIHAPRPREYRARIYPYRRPHDIHIIWSHGMRDDYIRMYPRVKRWHYSIGYRIPAISAYDALYYKGEVMNVYGKIYEVYYSAGTDEYYLYFGAYYPYHDFTVVLPGWIARRYSSHPESYLEREHMIVTGLISTFDDKPEIVVKRASQISLY